MICEYYITCGKNCTQNINNNTSGIQMDWCDEMKKYLVYKTKSERKERKEKLAKLSKLK